MSDSYDPELEDEIDDEGQNDEFDGFDNEDDGSEDDDGVDDAGSQDGEGDEGSEGGAQPHGQVRQPSRRTLRVQEAINRAKAAEEKAERLERQLAERESARNSRSQAEADAAERQRLAEMDPEERVVYLLQKQENTFNQRLGQVELRAADNADRVIFDNLCATNKTAARMKTQVENELAKLRREGKTTDRRTILAYLIGDKALNTGERTRGKAARAAEQNRERNKAQPGAGRGDAQGESRRAGADTKEGRYNRLKDVQI